MKKILQSLISLLVILPIIGNAQIAISHNDMPDPGDTIRLSSTIDFGTLNFEETGENFTWDFSSLNAITQTVDTFVSIQETPFIYQVVFFTSANLAKKLTDFDQFPGFQVTEPYEYYKNSLSDYRYVGVGITLNGIPLPNKYEEPDIIYRFPLEYGNLDSSYSSYEFGIPGIGYSGGWKKRVNQADGWGTLKTPYGNFDAIRVRSDVIQFDSLYIDSLGFGFPIYRNYIEYKWLGNGFGLPLCTVEDDGLLPTFTYIDSLRNATTHVDNIEENILINVYPNPVKDHLIIELTDKKLSEVSVSLYNLNGIEILTKRASLDNGLKNQVNLDLKNTDLRKGLYFLRINFKHSGDCIRKIVKL